MTFIYIFFFITECPPAADGMERFACPTPDRQGRYRCIDDHVLCDGFIDCPNGEDEDRQACMFYKTVIFYILPLFSVDMTGPTYCSIIFNYFQFERPALNEDLIPLFNQVIKFYKKITTYFLID